MRETLGKELLALSLMILSFFIVSGGALALIDAQISDLQIDKQAIAQNGIATVTICVRNTGDTTFNFPIGLSIGWNWDVGSYYFLGEHCNSACYTDMLGNYTYTGSLAPAHEACVQRTFNFDSSIFGVGKKYDILTAVYNATYLPVTSSLDYMAWKNAVLVTSATYLYQNSMSCNSGWGLNGELKECVTPNITIPSFCPDKYVVENTFVKYNFTCANSTNYFGFNDQVAVNFTIGCQDQFYIYTTDLTGLIAGGTAFFVHPFSTPTSNQSTLVGGKTMVFCNFFQNFSIEPSVINYNLTSQTTIAYLLRVNNTGNEDLFNLTVQASDFRWMCIKDQTNTYHTTPFQISIPANTFYDMAVSFAPTGGGPGNCNNDGLPTPELNGTIHTFVQVSNSVTRTADQYFGMTFVQPTPGYSIPNASQPIAGLNQTKWNQAGWGWVLIFLNPIFLSTVIVAGISGGIAKISNSAEIGVSSFILLLLVVVFYNQLLPEWMLAVFALIAVGVFAWFGRKLFTGGG